MTVCIACLSNKSKAVVVASDRMITADFLAKQFEHKGTKISVITEKIVALTAGSATRYLDILRNTKSRLRTDAPNENLSEVIKIICEEYEKLRNIKIEEKFFKPMGIDRNGFYGEYVRRLPEEVASGLDELVHNYDFGISLIIAGTDQTGAHIYDVSNPGTSECLDSIGYHSIGIGQSHSLLSLISSGAYPNDELLNTIYYVYEAKKKAENAPGVGSVTDMAAITAEGMRVFKQEDLDLLKETYDKLNKPKKSNVLKLLKGLKI